MIIVLLLLLLINLFISYKVFRYFISPPFLMGAGLLLATIVAAFHYSAWELDTFSVETVIVAGGGTLWFTFLCILFSNKNSIRLPNAKRKEIDFSNVDVKKVKSFLVFLILLGFLTLLIRIKVYAAFFGGNLNVASLIWAAREDATEGDQAFVLPLFVKLPSIINSLASYFTIWLLALQMHTKARDKQLVRLLVIQVVLVCLDGMLGGAKGGIIDPVIRYFILHILFVYYERRSIKLPKKFYYRFAILLCIGIFSFQALNIIMGRQIEEVKSVDLFSIYCGAEIKNLDTYIQNPAQYGTSKYWGGTTFNNFYAYLGKKDNDYGAKWEYVGGENIGNVYTQFYPFHRDWGVPGVFLILIFVAMVSMLFYKKALEKLCKNPTRPSVFLLLYSVMAGHVAMSFFSSRFTEVVFQPGFVKVIIYVWIMKQLFITFFIKKKYEHKAIDGSYTYV